MTTHYCDLCGKSSPVELSKLIVERQGYCAKKADICSACSDKLISITKFRGWETPSAPPASK